MADQENDVLKSSIPRTFAKNFHELRMKKLGLSEKEMGEKIKVSQSTISRWENNLDSPRLSDIQALIDTFQEVDYGYVTRMLGLENTGSFRGIHWVEREVLVNIPDNQYDEVNNSIRLAKTFFQKVVVDQLPMSEILTSLGGTDPDIIYAAVQLAMRVGALEIVDVERHTELEDSIKKKYGIENVIVARLPEDDKGRFPDGTLIRAEVVAALAAKHLPERLETAKNAIGWGSGYTLQRICQRMITDIAMLVDATWVPLMGFRTSDFLSPYTANSMCREMASRFYKSKALHLPFMNNQDASSMDIEAWEYVKNTPLSTAFLSVNGAGRVSKSGIQIQKQEFQAADRRRFYDLDRIFEDMSKNQKKNIAGEMMGMFFDKDGKMVAERQTKKAVYSLGIDVLRDMMQKGRLVWIVAARSYKAEMTRVALENGFANAVVIDQEIATYLTKDKIT